MTHGPSSKNEPIRRALLGLDARLQLRAARAASDPRRVAEPQRVWNPDPEPAPKRWRRAWEQLVTMGLAARMASGNYVLTSEGKTCPLPPL